MKSKTPPQLQGLMILSKPKVFKEPRTRRSGGQGGAPAHGERGKSSFARLRCPQTQQGRESRKKLRDRARAGGPPARGLPGAASAPTLLPLPGGAGREHKRLQLPSGRGPTPPTPGPGQARGKEVGRKRQGGRELARIGWAGPATQGGGWDEVRGEGAGTYLGSRDSQNGRKSC